MCKTLSQVVWMEATTSFIFVDLNRGRNGRQRRHRWRLGRNRRRRSMGPSQSVSFTFFFQRVALSHQADVSCLLKERKHLDRPRTMDSISKRLHISGLTPQITPSDLSARFSSFGTVKALDGLGKLDGNGQPRPYAYLTLETSKSQLAKCEQHLPLLKYQPLTKFDDVSSSVIRPEFT